MSFTWQHFHEEVVIHRHQSPHHPSLPAVKEKKKKRFYYGLVQSLSRETSEPLCVILFALILEKRILWALANSQGISYVEVQALMICPEVR